MSFSSLAATMRQFEAVTNPQSHGTSIPIPIFVVGIVVILAIAGLMFARSRKK
jgi:LPXTG-motif cell wall-anchored protein